MKERPPLQGEFAPHENARIQETERRERMLRTEEDLAEEKDPTPKGPSNLRQRAITGVIYIAVTVACLMIGNVTTMLYVAAVAAICAGEFYYMLRRDAKLANDIIGIAAAALYPASTFFFGMVGPVYVTVVFVLAVTVWYVYWPRARLSEVGICLFGALYTGLFLSCLLMIRMSLDQPWGGVLALVIFVSVEFNDVAAYLVGSKIGKHKLAPRVSPKKSWEGFIAGLIVSMLIWCILVFIPGITISIPQALIFGLICGAVGVMGDLCESRIKRSVGFKDSGTILPGHGGMFDRSDSLILASVFAAVLLFAFGCIPLPL